jgi:prepilin signal peptidase PulO-like enzyme (type II secretory pathway)
MLWVILCTGALVGSGAITVAQRLLLIMNEPSPRQRLPFWMYAVGVVTGGITGLSIHHSSQVAPSTLLVIVMLIFLVQAPIDFTTHRLIRPVTYLFTAITACVMIVDVVAAEPQDGGALQTTASALMVMLLVIGSYALFHRLSPRSLGWGDVLLVAPLSLAVGYVHLGSVAVWQLVASLTGAVHALAIRRKSTTVSIAFGPHLLCAAWLVLLLSV